MTTQLDFMRVPFAADLASYGDRPAILTDTLALTYRELAERVDDLAVRLGTERRLVALAAANDVESLVAYLAALVGGHPLILLPEDKPAALESLVAAYDPDVILRSGNGRTVLITPPVPIVTLFTALPLMEPAGARPAEALVVGHAPLDAKYSPTLVLAAEARPRPSETRARFV